ncbi:hypothetical protein FH508_0011520 [Lysinibacillus sp. CD3-6]|uniref:hypothetical protein n=1 Tax=Lysinibacillus sp. CD3-6 TaxID=2892541 RepID=UPI0011718089|nr:hypothetical protein [Lysinibacillus sp. CD3-6]UED82492.1 hypothetical protein FH508_0011520 [Lysinibacillus sp. CD3-6]
MNKKEFVWDRGWIHSYLSNWCIFERFKYSNALNNNDILRIFGNNNVNAVKRIEGVGDYLRDLVILTGIDEGKAIEIFGINLKRRNSLIYKKIRPILGLTFAYAIRENITICPCCIKFGFHSIFHQMTLFKTCIYHTNETLVDSCEKCGNILGKYLLSNFSNPPFTCACGFCLLDNNNVVSIFKSWKNKFRIDNEELINLLNIYKSQKETPLLIQPIRILRKYNEFDQSNLSRLIDYQKNYYLNKEFNENTILKEVYSQNFLSSKNALKTIMTNYKYNFNYRYNIRSFLKKDKIDAVFYDVYMQSREIYKAIKRYLMKNYLNDHTTCIQLNNELKANDSFCGFSLAFTFWREEFEEINLSQKVKQGSIESKIFNFECYLERFSLYPKGIYANYLEELLDKCFNITQDVNSIDINQIKKVINTMLPYLLLERFAEYLDLILNPTKYKPNNYYLHDIIPMHLIVIEQHIQETTIYHQNIFNKLEKLIQDMQKEKNICGFDKNFKYERYRTPSELAILKMDLNRGENATK